MATDYEYAITVLVGHLGPVKDFETLSQDQKSAALATSLGQVAKQLTESLPKLPPGGWQAVSHDLAIYGQAVIVTFLVRRPC